MAGPSRPDRLPHRAQARLHPGRWPGGQGLHLHHEALLTLARKIHAAALDDDPQRLEQATLYLFDALASHLRDETVAMTTLSPAQARILERGQQRLLALAAELVDEAASGCTQPPERCRRCTEEFLAFLALQARDERIALDDPAA